MLANKARRYVSSGMQSESGEWSGDRSTLPRRRYSGSKCIMLSSISPYSWPVSNSLAGCSSCLGPRQDGVFGNDTGGSLTVVYRKHRVVGRLGYSSSGSWHRRYSNARSPSTNRLLSVSGIGHKSWSVSRVHISRSGVPAW